MAVPRSVLCMLRVTCSHRAVLGHAVGRLHCITTSVDWEVFSELEVDTDEDLCKICIWLGCVPVGRCL